MALLLFFYIILFLLGLIVGSFLNCVIYRLEKKESFLKGRSYCPNCKHKLRWQDLIPLLSFLELRGKCRYCKKPISFQYPIVELATGILFVLVTYNLQLTTHNSQLLLDLGYQLFIVSCLLVVFVYDLEHYLIPDEVVFPAIIISFFYQIFGNWKLEIGNLLPILNPLFSALGASLFFLAIFLISRGKWLGFGDVKLGFLMGLFLGFPNILVALFLSFLIGAIIGLGLILSGKKSLKSEVPFGPFLITGTFIALFFGGKIINWYFSPFLLK